MGYYGFDGNLDDRQAEGKTAGMVINAASPGNLVPTDTAPVYADGVKGNGILLNSQEKKAMAELNNQIPNGASDFSINMWVQPKKVENAYSVMLFGGDVSNHIGLALYGSRGGATVGSIYPVSGAQDTVTEVRNGISSDQWFMYTWVNSKDKMVLYINGVKAGEGPAVSKPINRLFLGGSWWGDYFHGVFDEVSIYDCTLTKDEVAELYHHVPWAVSEVTYEKTIEVTKSNASEEAVKAQLGTLLLKAAIEYGEEAPVLESVAADKWTLTGTAEEGYTASATLVLPEGYVWKDGTRNVPLEVKVTVRPGELKEIRITPPEKTDYIVDELFDRTGMKVEAVYEEDGVVLDETSDVTNLSILSDGTSWKETDPLTEGEKTITVTYGDKTATFTIIVQTMEEARMAYYTFEGNLSNGKDGTAKIVNDNTASLTEDSSFTPEYPEGIKGKGILFNSDARKEKALQLVETMAQDKRDFTINLWVQPKALDEYAMILCSTGTIWKELALYAAPTGKTNAVEAQREGATPADFRKSTFDNQLFIDKWTMLTWVNTETEMTLYVDGTAVGTGGAAINGLSKILLGGSRFRSAFYGIFDEVSIYDRTLSAKQVKYLYDLIPHTISKVSVSKEKLMFLLDDIKDDTSKIKEALSKLEIDVSMIYGEKCEFKNDADWTLSAENITAAGAYTATKTLDLPEGYVLNGTEERTVTVEVAIDVKDAVLDRIEIKTLPNKRAYLVGNLFDKTGMKVEAVYTKDGSESREDVTEQVTVLNADQPLQTTDKSVTVSYTEGGTTKTAEVAIDVYTADQPESMYASRTAYYTFDDTLANEQIAGKTAKMMDKSGDFTYSDVGTEFNPVYENGIKGNGLLMNGNTGDNKALELDATIPEEQKNFSINLWVKPKELSPGWRMILSSTGEQSRKELVLYANPDGTAQNTIAIQSGTGVNQDAVEEKRVSDVLSQDKWVMLTWVNTDSKMQLYVNGKHVSDGVMAKYGCSRIFLGGGNWNSAFRAVYDEVSIFECALDATQVDSLYSAIPSTVSEISVSEKSLVIPKGATDEATQQKIKEALSKLKVNVSMKKGEAPTLVNNADWTLTKSESEDAYTAAKTFVLPEGYVMEENANAEVSVNVTVKTGLTSVEVTRQPFKTEYIEGEIFDSTGMMVTATFSDNTRENVTSQIEIEGAGEVLKAGTTEIILRYPADAIKELKVPITVLTVKESLEKARLSSYSFENNLDNGVLGGAAAKLVNGNQTMSDGTIAADYQEGKSGKGIQLNASAAATALELAGHGITSGAKDFTINFWVKPADVDTDWQTLLMGGTVAWNRALTIYAPMGANATGSISLIMNDPDNSITDAKVPPCVADVLRVGEWRMFTWANSENGMRLYVDGQKVYENTSTGVTDSFTRLFLAGSWWGNPFKGIFDEVSTYNRTLTEAQVQYLFEHPEQTSATP